MRNLLLALTLLTALPAFGQEAPRRRARAGAALAEEGRHHLSLSRDDEVPPAVVLPDPVTAPELEPLPRRHRSVRYSLGGGATVVDRDGDATGVARDDTRFGGEVRGTFHADGPVTDRDVLSLRLDVDARLRMVDGPGGMTYLVTGEASGEAIIAGVNDPARVHVIVNGDAQDLGDLASFRAGAMICFSNNHREADWHFMMCVAGSWLRAQGFGRAAEEGTVGGELRFEYGEVLDIIARLFGTMPDASANLWSALARLRVHMGEIRAIGVYDISTYVEASWLRAALPPSSGGGYTAVESVLMGSGGIAVEF